MPDESKHIRVPLIPQTCGTAHENEFDLRRGDKTAASLICQI